MRTVQGISFDLWGTLIKSHPDYKRQREECIADHLCIYHGFTHVDTGNVANTVRQFEKMLDHYSEATGCQIPVDHSYKTLLRSLGVTDKLNESSARLQSRLFELLVKYPPRFIEGVKEVLIELVRRKVRVGICSNTNLIRGNDLVLVLDLYTIFKNNIIWSDERSYCKPDFRMFTDVFSKINVKGFTIHVGDNPNTDGPASKFGTTEVIIVNQPNTPKIGELITHLKDKGWLQHKPLEQSVDIQ